MYHGAYISVEQELEAFNRVTLADLKRLLAQWPLWPMTIVSVGPTTDVSAGLIPSDSRENEVPAEPLPRAGSPGGSPSLPHARARIHAGSPGGSPPRIGNHHRVRG